MKKGLLTLVALLAAWVAAWAQDYADHRSEQFATYGTDFWFTIPTTIGGGSASTYMLCVVAKNDCMVTVEVPRRGYWHTYRAYNYQTINIRLDTLNFFDMPSNMVKYVDELDTSVTAFEEQTAYWPQDRGVHVYSTDTIAVIAQAYAAGAMDATNVLPTHMLRDEYVISSYPEAFMVNGSYFDVIATEDSTIVDIILGDDDWTGHHKGDTITHILHRGQMFHERPYPLTNRTDPSLYPRRLNDTIMLLSHGFTPHLEAASRYTYDVSNTRVKARNHKRIAVMEGNRHLMVPFTHETYGTMNADIGFEQAIPIRYAGKEFLVPYLQHSNVLYLRFTGLEDSTMVNIISTTRRTDSLRQMSLNAYETDWFQMEHGEGPFYITSNKPILLKAVTMGNNRINGTYGDPAMLNIIPTSWWNSNPIHYHTPFYTDKNWNIYGWKMETYIFARTEDVPYMRMDSYNISEHFQRINGTPFSYAHLDRNMRYNTFGVHSIECTRPAFFMAFFDHYGSAMRTLCNLPHVQPGGCYLTVNDIPADSLKIDSVWCKLDKIEFRGWSERPADSILWDFGDGTRLHLPYDEGQMVTHTYTDTGHFRVMRVISWRDESKEDCMAGYFTFTRTPDTMYAPLCMQHRYDTTITVRLCEGSYFFRGNEYSYTDTFYDTSYWSQSGCDSLFVIDLVTCPHCHTQFDTIAPSQLPWTYEGETFNSEVNDYPIHLDIGDDCDSIIYYYLTVIKHWGEPPLDSVILMAPNIFTPNGESNQTFHIVANKHISAMEVTIYERQGMQVAHYDGLTHDWDGTKDGRPMKQGSYVYYIRYMDSKVNGWKTMKGTVTLIR